MSYKLDEIIDYLVEDECFVEHLYSQLYDLFCCEYTTECSITIPEFEFEGKNYPLKTFNFKRKFKEVSDDYCEGKYSHHYEIKLTDKDNGDIYEVYTDCYNGEWRSVEVELLESKKKKTFNPCCEEQKIISVKSTSDDLEIINEENMQEVSLKEAGIGVNNSLELYFCLSCRKMQ